jgi:hypothetical protein
LYLADEPVMNGMETTQERQKSAVMQLSKMNVEHEWQSVNHF